MPPNLSPSSSALPATDSGELSYYESATRWFGRVLTPPSLETGAKNVERQSSLQSPGLQQIVGEELPPAEGSVIRAVLSPLRALASALGTLPGVPDRDDPLPASLIFGDSDEPHGGSIGAGSTSSGAAQTAPTEAPPAAEAAGAKGSSRSSGAGGSGGGGDCGPSPSESSASHLHPDKPNDADGIRDDGGSRSAGNDIVAEVTDIVAEVSIGLTDSDGGGGGGGGGDSGHGGSGGSVGSGSGSSTVPFAPLQVDVHRGVPRAPSARRVPLGTMTHLPSGEDLMYAKASEVSAVAERRAGTAWVLREGGVLWRVAQELRESAAGRWLGLYLFGHELTSKEEFDVTLLPPQELDRVQRAFAFFDKDGSGSLEGDEVTAVLRVLGTNPLGKDEKAIFEQIDTDHSGTVSFSELAGLFWAQPRAAHAWEEWEELECAFEMLFPRRGPHRRNSLSVEDLRGRWLSPPPHRPRRRTLERRHRATEAYYALAVTCVLTLQLTGTSSSRRWGSPSPSRRWPSSSPSQGCATSPTGTRTRVRVSTAAPPEVATPTVAAPTEILGKRARAVLGRKVLGNPGPPRPPPPLPSMATAVLKSAAAAAAASAKSASRASSFGGCHAGWERRVRSCARP